MLSCSMLLVTNICHSVDRYCRGVSLTKIWASLLTKMLTVLHFVGRSLSCLIYSHYTLYPLDVYPFLTFWQRYLSAPCIGHTDATNVTLATFLLHALWACCHIYHLVGLIWTLGILCLVNWDRLGSWLVNNCLVCCLFCLTSWFLQALVLAYNQVVRVACSFCCGWPSRLNTCGFFHCTFVMNVVVLLMLVFFYIGSRPSEILQTTFCAV